MDIVCPSEGRIKRQWSLSEEAWYRLYNSGVVDNSGWHGEAISLNEAAQVALWGWCQSHHVFLVLA